MAKAIKHGTRAGYFHHRAACEPACAACKQANADYVASWRAAQPRTRIDPRIARAEELRKRIHQHLMAHPDTPLTAHEIARVLGRGPAGVCGVKCALQRMHDHGEAQPVVGPKAPGDRRAVTRWRAT